MAQEPPKPRRRHNPWLPAFILAVAAVIGSFAGLGVVTYRALNASSSATTASPGPSPTSTAALTYSGTLPAGFEDAQLVPAPAGQTPDLAFTAAAGATRVPYHYFVPVAALGEGIDALTGDQLAALISGHNSNWSDVGGVPGRVTLVAADVPADEAVIASFTGNARPAQTFPTYADLLSAMTVSSGMIAFLPLDEVRFSVSAIAIDGIDIVRGRGDAGSWPFVERVGIAARSSRGRAALGPLASRLTESLPKVTHVVATGDILQSRCSLTKIEATGDWAAALRSPVGDYLRSADLALGSLDGSIQDISPPYGCVEMTNLSSPPQTIAALTYAGFDEMTVATNHVFDCGMVGYCGARAFLETLNFLHQAGIQTVGGGNNIEQAHQPAIFDINGVTFGILGYDDISADVLGATATSPGTAGMDDSYADELATPPKEPSFYKPASMLQTTRMEADIKALKKKVDVVIVQVQTGFEDTHDASPRSIKGLRAAADAGADLVIGNQGHVVQPIEVRGDSFIAYALGNFIFDQRHTVDETQGYLLEADFWGKKLANLRMVPYEIQDQYKPMFVSGATSQKIFTDIASGTADLPPPDAAINQ